MNADEVVGGTYICRRIANENSLKDGDSFTVSPCGASESYELKVAWVIRSVTKNIVITPAYAETLGISYRIDSVYTLTDKADIVQDSAIKSVQSKQMIVDSFDTFTELMDMMVVILILGAALLGIVVLYNLGVITGLPADQRRIF